ncbi:MAG: carbohydrate kinase family protein [Fimbriimonadaceae bacterium]|nr:carbohydrate kinase family protein [Fimbriimonadaceae bacterium]
MERAIEVVVAGHVCLDMIPLLPRSDPFAPGTLVEIGPARFATGGPVSNTGLSLHRLGASVRLIGKVGDDHFGGLLRDLFEREGPGLAQGLVEARGETTSYSIVMSPPGVDRTFLHAPGANATFRSADVSDDALSDARVLHFGYPPVMRAMWEQEGAECASLFRRAKALGLTTSLDMCYVDPNGEAGRADWRAFLERTLPFVDVFVPSLEEVAFMLRRPLPTRRDRAAIRELVAELLDLGPLVAGVKVGSAGTYAATAPTGARWSDVGAGGGDAGWVGREAWQRCFVVDVRGTTGSGDATIAGLLFGLVRAMGFEESLRAACAVGACCCEAPDSVSGIRPWRDVAARLAAGWAERDDDRTG